VALNLAGPGAPAVALAQFGRRVVDLPPEHAQLPGHPDEGRAVPEVSQHLAGDGGHREGQEVDLPIGLEPVHGHD
jgi:hypothetical protein